MAELLAALMKKGGGSGESDFLDENQYLKATGDSSTQQTIATYELNETLQGLGGSHNYLIIANVKGHTTAIVHNDSIYDGIFGVANGNITQILFHAEVGTHTIDITQQDFLIFISQGYTNRYVKIVE